jgi:hypothetical protein
MRNNNENIQQAITPIDPHNDNGGSPSKRLHCNGINDEIIAPDNIDVCATYESWSTFQSFVQQQNTISIMLVTETNVKVQRAVDIGPRRGMFMFEFI